MQSNASGGYGGTPTRGGGGGYGPGSSGDLKGGASALPYGGGGMGDDAALPPGWGPVGGGGGGVVGSMGSMRGSTGNLSDTMSSAPQGNYPGPPDTAMGRATPTGSYPSAMPSTAASSMSGMGGMGGGGQTARWETEMDVEVLRVELRERDKVNLVHSPSRLVAF